jgi:serine/threonine protein kinase
VSTLGRFEIVQELGRGGMGVVFRAHDPEMSRDVALKVLRLDPSLGAPEQEEIQRRFDREAKSAGGLNHPNIVAHYERGEAGGYKYIVMEFVDGRALHSVMAEGPRPDLESSLAILGQMAAGLDYAHGRGVIHRDIKPANVLLAYAGGAKIADFGIAKSTLAGSMTSASMVIGSPHYMSPEQIEGRGVTGRADQWSLAVTAYELLAGRKPFDSDSIAALFQQILATQPRDPREFDRRIPSAARLVFEKAMSKAPEERYENCAAFVEALAAAAYAPAPSPAVEPVTTTSPATRPTTHVPSAKSARWTLLAGIPLFAALMICAGVLWLPKSPHTAGVAFTAAPGKAPAAVTPADPSLKAGQARVNRRDDLIYLWIPSGTFRMGCSPGDTDCRPDETPHDVAISRGFWLSQAEVTAAAYKHFSLATEAAMPKPPDDNPNWTDLTRPVSNVTWDGAAAYCRWTEGRLPTEAEWEYAARAGAAQERYGPIAQIAWFAGNSGAHAHPVKTLQPNAFGLFDMLGNVWEWTADFYGREYYSQSPAQDPAGPARGEYRVLRGGSWLRSPADVRVSLRYPTLAGSPDQVVGFRCAATDLP